MPWDLPPLSAQNPAQNCRTTPPAHENAPHIVRYYVDPTADAAVHSQALHDAAAHAPDGAPTPATSARLVAIVTLRRPSKISAHNSR
jgi:hypothetical protein